MKEHLARKSGKILPCWKVPADVRAHKKEYMTNSSFCKLKAKELVKDAYEEVEEVEAQEVDPTVKYGKKECKGSIGRFYNSKTNLIVSTRNQECNDRQASNS